MTAPLRPDDLPPDAPYQPEALRGCLCCHTEGSVGLVEGRKFLGFGGGPPILTCRVCGSSAVFEPGPPDAPESWRIRYKKVNRAAEYYYVRVMLGTAGWLSAEEALRLSQNGYIQRHRVAQTERDDLRWLHPAPLIPPPPFMSPEEAVYVKVNPAILNAGDEETALDSGAFYLTGQKIHLIGRRRDWSHRLSEITAVSYTDAGWRIAVRTGGQTYHAGNHPDQIDAQLFVAVLKALMRRSLDPDPQP
jgi:hypothetical protein